MYRGNLLMCKDYNHLLHISNYATYLRFVFHGFMIKCLLYSYKSMPLIVWCIVAVWDCSLDGDYHRVLQLITARGPMVDTSTNLSDNYIYANHACLQTYVMWCLFVVHNVVLVGWHMLSSARTQLRPWRPLVNIHAERSILQLPL